MDLRERLSAETKAAMRSRDAPRLSTLRLIAAAIKDREIAMRGEPGAEPRLSDAELAALLGRMIKQRQESARAYEEGGRLELAEFEQREIALIQQFLPRQHAALLRPRVQVADVLNAAQAQAHAEQRVLYLVEFQGNAARVVRGRQRTRALRAQRRGAPLREGVTNTGEIQGSQGAGIERHLTGQHNNAARGGTCALWLSEVKPGEV